MAVAADFIFTYHPSQRQRFRDGSLVTAWREKYHNLFDEKDEELARNQPQYHFYEWLSAILLHEATGYISLVEGYIAHTHPRKREIFSSRVPAEVFDFVTANQSGLPDLFAYSSEGDDWFFCEVKGAYDKVRTNQSDLFERLGATCKRRVRVIHLREFRP